MSLFIQVYLIGSSLLLCCGPTAVWTYPCVDGECTQRKFISAEEDITAAGPIIICVNDEVYEGENIEIQCTANDPPDERVIFILRGRERACDDSSYTANDTESGGSYWEVHGNASHCKLTVHKAQSSDGGDYICKAGEFTSKPATVDVIPVTLLIGTLVPSALVVIVLTVLLSVVLRPYWKRKNPGQEMHHEPPSPVPTSSDEDTGDDETVHTQSSLHLSSRSPSPDHPDRDQSETNPSPHADTSDDSDYPPHPEPLHESVESSRSIKQDEKTSLIPKHPHSTHRKPGMGDYGASCESKL